MDIEAFLQRLEIERKRKKDRKKREKINRKIERKEKRKIERKKERKKDRKNKKISCQKIKIERRKKDKQIDRKKEKNRILEEEKMIEISQRTEFWPKEQNYRECTSRFVRSTGGDLWLWGQKRGWNYCFYTVTGLP